MKAFIKDKYIKIAQSISYKHIAWTCLIVLGLSLLPIVYCSFFNYATGDDLWEGASAYHVLQNHGSIVDFFKAIFSWAKRDYLGWEGNWSSIFLWCIPPNIWGEKFYMITAWIALVSICVGTGYFLHHFLGKYLSANKYLFIVLFSVLCILSIQYMPYMRGGLFWYTGMINYTFPYGLSLMVFVWIDKFLESGKRRYFVYLISSLSYMGGAGYLTVVLCFEVIFMVIVWKIITGNPLHKKRALWLLVPWMLLIIGFIISACSPGNAVRGGDDYGFSILNILTTLKECLICGIRAIPDTFIRVRPLFLFVFMTMLITWELVDVEHSKLSFKYPIQVSVLLFLISCSVYAPQIYANDEVSGGVPDTIFWVFLITMMLCLIYCTGAVKKKYIKKSQQKKWLKTEFLAPAIRTPFIILTLLFCVVAGKYLVGNTTDYTCITFALSGQLEDFEEQMQERLAILNDPNITDVVLPEMNDEQGPFMHMPITSDPNSYTNMATAFYYQKKSVIAIPREEYYKK